tara:strand:+ start:69 stop:983 length:915 start_codon:yes stop_codon:yes gene_type:complete
MKDQERILQYLNGSLSAKEKEEFMKTEDYQFIDQVTQSLQAFKAPTLNTEEALTTLKHRQSKQAKAVEFSLWNNAWKVAASIAIVAAALWFLYPKSSTEQFVASNEQQTEWILPDASKVVLNKHSELSYSEEEWENSRNLQLSGEAYFEVEKGSQFTVTTTSGTVTVLGTRFTVNSREDYYEVTCYEGTVAVTTTDPKDKDAKTILTKGEQVRWVNDRVQRNTVRAVHPSWESGFSDFEEVPFYFVIKEFERQYDVTVEYPESEAERLFTGSFHNEDFNSALKAITIPLSLEFQTKGNSVTLSK